MVCKKTQNENETRIFTQSYQGRRFFILDLELEQAKRLKVWLLEIPQISRIIWAISLQRKLFCFFHALRHFFTKFYSDFSTLENFLSKFLFWKAYILRFLYIFLPCRRNKRSKVWSLQDQVTESYKLKKLFPSKKFHWQSVSISIDFSCCDK